MEKNITRLGCTEYTMVHIGERNGAEEEEGNCNCKETMPSLPRLLALEGQKLSRDNVLHSDCTSLTYNLRTTLKFFLLKAELTH